VSERAADYTIVYLHGTSPIDAVDEQGRRLQQVTDTMAEKGWALAMLDTAFAISPSGEREYWCTVAYNDGPSGSRFL
jgi:hypothetical protein